MHLKVILGWDAFLVKTSQAFPFFGCISLRKQSISLILLYAIRWLWNSKSDSVKMPLSFILSRYIQCCCWSVAQSCPTLCDPVDCSTPGFPVFHHLLELAQTHVHRVGDAINHLVLCCPLLLLPSVFLSIRVFCNELVLHICWPNLERPFIP